MKLTIEETPIAGLKIVKSSAFNDIRGSFARFFGADELAPVLGRRRIFQINWSRTLGRGALRGLHFQWPPHAEMKLVRCLRGRVFDVAVDLRRGSPTLFQWHATVLSPDALNMFILPEGFAHGFQVLEPDSELLYLHTCAYVPGAEGGAAFDDPTLAIRWPLDPIQISDRDRGFAPLAVDFSGLDT